MACCPTPHPFPHFNLSQVSKSYSNQRGVCRVAHVRKTFGNFTNTAIWRNHNVYNDIVCLTAILLLKDGKQPPNFIFIIKCGQDFTGIPFRDEIILANDYPWLYLYYLCKNKKKSVIGLIPLTPSTTPRSVAMPL